MTVFRPRVLVLLVLIALLAASLAFGKNKEGPVKKIYQFEVENIDGDRTNLEQYQGKVLLIVNTASKCGFTKQYADLQNLYEQYKDRGLVVLGFPANNFRNQEPGSNSEIASFCSADFGVTFPMFAKISVKGDDQHPLYQYLTSKQTNPEYSGKITWNFNKFLVSRDGDIINRFATRTNPMEKKVKAAIETALDN